MDIHLLDVRAQRVSTLLESWKRGGLPPNIARALREWAGEFKKDRQCADELRRLSDLHESDRENDDYLGAMAISSILREQSVDDRTLRTQPGRSYRKPIQSAIELLQAFAKDVSTERKSIVISNARMSTVFTSYENEEQRAKSVKASGRSVANENGRPIAFDGQCTIHFPDGDAIGLSKTQSEVISVLVTRRAVDSTTLVNQSKHDDAVKNLKRLVGKYPRLKGAIKFPGRERGGGYSTTIVSNKSLPNA